MAADPQRAGEASSIDWSRYAEIVGPRSDYYLPRFQRFARGEWMSWNWAAFFATFAWLRYRRLYAWSWLYLLASAPVLLCLCMIAANASDPCYEALQPRAPLLFRLLVGAWVLFDWIAMPLVANRLYFRLVRAIVGKSAASAGTGAAPVPARSAIVFALGVQGFILCVVAVASAQYVNAAYRMRVSNALSLAENYRAHFEEYFQAHGSYPTQIEQIPSQFSDESVASVVLEQDGTIKALIGDRMEGLAGHSVRVVPTLKDGAITWSCRSPDLPQACLPRSCQAAQVR